MSADSSMHPIDRSSKVVKGYNKVLEGLAKTHIENQVKIAELEKDLKALKSDQFKLETVDIPDAMSVAGQTAVTLASGAYIIVRPRYEIRMPKLPDGKEIDRAKANKFCEWMEEHGHFGLVDNVLKVHTRDEALITAIKNLCKKLDIECSSAYEYPHWKTLESWFGKEVEKGTELPYDLFEYWIGTRASVK
jgi:hypothetical protein